MKTTSFSPHKSSLGVDANLLVLLLLIATALFAWIPFVGFAAWVVPLVFFFVEKNSKFVKFQMVQALILGVIQAIIALIFYIISLSLVWSFALSALVAVVWIGRIVNLAFSALFIYILIMAYGYKQVELPILGPIAHKATDKLEDIKTSVTASAQPGGNVSCPFCGAANPAGTNFCSACGKSLV
ncbi:MAG: hypothetical protein LBR76_05470 [Oscillospiraceae bacterium]|nr:hypothetical protein [Oscillospiraceae bacterium]